VKGGDCDRILGTIPTYARRELRKTTKIERKVGVPAEYRTGDLPIVNLQRYPYTKPLDSLITHGHKLFGSDFD
jgi:hypothetical protein